eukprot:COSAG05_NODE_209_length_14039_cov_138.574892_4_plen_336_part_00
MPPKHNRPASLASTELAHDGLSPQRKKSAAEKEIDIGLRVGEPIDSPAPAPSPVPESTASNAITVASASPGVMDGEPDITTEEYRKQQRQEHFRAFEICGDGNYRYKAGTLPPDNMVYLFSSNASGHSLIDGSGPSFWLSGSPKSRETGYWPNSQQPKGGGQYGCTECQRTQMSIQLHQMRITMSVKLSLTKQEKFCFLGDFDFKTAEEQQYRDHFKPGTIKQAYGTALMQIFNYTDMPEIIVSGNQTPTSGVHVQAPSCLFKRDYLDEKNIDEKKLYDHIVSTAHQVFDEQVGTVTPNKIWDAGIMTAGGVMQLRIDGLPKDNFDPWIEFLASD